MLVHDYMTRDVECITPEATLKAAAERMRVCNVGLLPVCDKGRLVGLLTDRDIAVRAVNRGMDALKTRVKDVMSRNTAVCRDDQELVSAAKTMENQRVRRLPVLDDGDRLVGVLSMTDFTKGDEGRAILPRMVEAVAAQHV
ncbi:MAG: CBS domain-containing protein [Elusimicrobia bacterium]|nr:CBS domain-containing protein [Elusimicrobiota bacterium]